MQSRRVWLVKAAVRRTFGPPSLELYRHLPSPAVLAAARRINGIQLLVPELEELVGTLKNRAPCNLLVFGLGNDSRFWRTLNQGGQTVFLEDDPDWLRRVTAADPQLTAYPVTYTTQLKNWQSLLDAPAKLDLELPLPVRATHWDVILVDAPRAWYDNSPGRMQSIFAASHLAAPNAHVFVHDCDRKVEQVYCDRYLHPENLVTQVERLRHYRVK